MRMLMRWVRRAAWCERGLMHLHVIVRMRGSVKNGTRGVGPVLVGGQGIEGFGEGWDGGEWLICGQGILRECSGCSESGKREAECAARGIHERNGTPEARMGTHPWLESKTIPVIEDATEDTP